MKCPHCLVEINPKFDEKYLGSDIEGFWSIFHMICPNPKCKKYIIDLAKGKRATGPVGELINKIDRIEKRITIRPLTSNRPPPPAEVDKVFADDYLEACLVIPFSPKASAALSRRCLQNIIREKTKVKQGNLSEEIQQVIGDGKLPTYLSDSIDAIRNIGNFAAHPTKSKTTGEIVPVENGEAEWLLDVIESLFDFYFVQPKTLKKKRDALDKKLGEAGKPAMK